MNPAKSAFSILLTVIFLPTPSVVHAQSSGQSGFEQSTAILDTSVLFAIGAQEADQALRGSFGWPTFQEGFVEGVYFRFDPDGYARFSASPRLDEDVFEVICAEASTACIAKKEILKVGLTSSGQVQIRIDGITPDDTFFISDRKSELPLPPSILDPLTPRLETLLAGGGELLIKREIEVVQSVSLSGFSAVATYLRWVSQQQSPRVFPRGWPVPTQSQRLNISGLTQPNQWVSPNAGPQTAETTWHTQQELLKNQRLGAISLAGRTGTSMTPQFSGHAAFPQNSQTSNQVELLQRQITQLQNNLLQFQPGSVRNPSVFPTGNSVTTGQNNPEDLPEFGQAFAQQAQGRSLPASAGGLGVNGDSSSASTGYLRSDSQNSFQSPSVHQSYTERPAAQIAEQRYLIQRIEAVEKSLLGLRRNMSLQILEIREELTDLSRAQSLNSQVSVKRPLMPTLSPSSGVSVENRTTTSAGILEELEKKLLARLTGKQQTKTKTMTANTPAPDDALINRQLIEDILIEMGKSEEALTNHALDQEKFVKTEAENDFVTLNDYINRVLSSDGEHLADPGR